MWLLGIHACLMIGFERVSPSQFILFYFYFYISWTFLSIFIFYQPPLPIVMLFSIEIKPSSNGSQSVQIILQNVHYKFSIPSMRDPFFNLFTVSSTVVNNSSHNQRASPTFWLVLPQLLLLLFVVIPPFLLLKLHLPFPPRL